MDKGGTLYTSDDHYGEFRALKVLIAANYSGAKVDIHQNQKLVYGDTNKSEDFLKKFPSGKLPAFESKDKKVHLTQSDAIAYYVSDDTLKGGKDEYTKAQVLQWLSFAETELLPGVRDRAWLFPTQSNIQFNKDHLAKPLTEFERLLHYMDNYLLDHTYLAGERITLADISIFTILFDAFGHLLYAGNRIVFVNVSRWFDNILNQPKVKDIISKAKLSSSYCVTPQLKEIIGGQTHTAAKNPENNEEETPKAAAPKPNEPAQEPAAEEMDEAEAPLEAEPKLKDPLVALPKRTRVINDVKRSYSKRRTRQRLFKCTKCTKQFKTNQVLNKHMITHTKTSKFMCTICKYQAQSNGDLKKHTVGVHGENPFKCEECGYKFGFKCNLERHIGRKHGTGDLVPY